MAGIGFELKKLFKGGGMLATLRGAAYASVTTIGPTVMVIAVLLTLYSILGYMDISFAERELLSSTFLYCFIFSMIVAAPVSIVMSRYIADMLFEEKQEDILPSYYMGLVVNMALAAVLGVPFALAEVFIGNVDPLFVFISYCMYAGLVITFYSMTFVTAIKEYKQVTYAYLYGMATAFLLAIVLHRFLGLAVIWAILIGFAVGFCLTSLLLLAQVRSFFRESSRNYRGCLVYFGRHRMLVISNLMYTLGLYAHNFVFWQSDLNIVIANVFLSAPAYDMATCLAMFTNISLTIIFVVRVETRFHERYQDYIEAVIGGKKSDIDYAKQVMFRTLSNEMWFVIQMQLIITVVLFFVATILLPLLGFGGLVFTIYPVLAATYIVIFVMQSMVVFLYYFEDQRGAVYTTAAYLVMTVLGSIFARDFLPPSLYGMGAFIGAFSGWVVVYMRLRRIEKNLDIQMFCRSHITPTRLERRSISTITRRGGLQGGR